MNGEPGSLASRGRRLGGAVIDIAIVLAIVLPISFFTGGSRELLAAQEIPAAKKILYACLVVVVWVVLNARLLASRGQTIGKTVVGTRIVDLQGGLLPFGKLLALRYLVPWIIGAIPSLGNLFNLADVLFIFARDRRCLHDHLAGTRVVNV